MPDLTDYAKLTDLENLKLVDLADVVPDALSEDGQIPSWNTKDGDGYFDFNININDYALLGDLDGYLSAVNTDSSLTGAGTVASPLSVKLNWIDYVMRWGQEPVLISTDGITDVYRYYFEGVYYYRTVPISYDPSLDKFYADSGLTQLLTSRATNSLLE